MKRNIIRFKCDKCGRMLGSIYTSKAGSLFMPSIRVDCIKCRRYVGEVTYCVTNCNGR